MLVFGHVHINVRLMKWCSFKEQILQIADPINKVIILLCSHGSIDKRRSCSFYSFNE